MNNGFKAVEPDVLEADAGQCEEPGTETVEGQRISWKALGVRAAVLTVTRSQSKELGDRAEPR